MNNRNKRIFLFFGLTIGFILINCNMITKFQVNDLITDRYSVSPLRDPNSVETKPTTNRDWLNLDTDELEALFASKKKEKPIFIDGNDDFIKQARSNQWPGKGTETQPYIIQDYNIRVSSRIRGKKPTPPAAVTIYNTNLYFNLTNNILDGKNGIPDGVLLENVSNGVIGPFNRIFNCKNGITLINSNFIEIYGNDIYAYVDTSSFSSSSKLKITGPAFISHGIFLDPSNNNSIINNRITDYTGSGIYILNSTNNTIDDNEINNINGESGIFLQGSNTTTIENNEVFVYSDLTASGQNIKYKILGPAFISHGIFLDPSYNNTIVNNNVSGYTGHGLYLYDSDENDIFVNKLNNSAVNFTNSAGIFLNGSDSNNITGNIVYGSRIPSPADQSIKYKIAGPAFISHGIFLDPSDNNTIKNNIIYNNTGNGLYLQESTGNEISGNQIAGNGENGIFLENTWDSNISGNIIYNDDLHAINLNFGSHSNNFGKNDLIGNNIGGFSQALDNGVDNTFINNFMVDHDNTDSDNDSFSDDPYYIEGLSENEDEYPKALPVQNLTATDIRFIDLDAWVDWESETLNLKNLGNWETVKVKLPEGYSVTNIDVSTVYTDGGIQADEEAQVQNERTLIVKFNRSALIEYLLMTLNLSDLPTDVMMNVTGYLNGDFLMFYGYDNVTVIHGEINLAVDVNLDADSLSEDITQILVKTISKSPALIINIFPLLLMITVIRKTRRNFKSEIS